MSRRPPVTDADRWELSRAMLAVAEQAEDIQTELAAHGHDRPGAIAREAQLALAERVSSRQGLRDYWREAAREWLSALDAPIDILKGHYAAPYGYRSPLIAELRSRAHLLPAGEIGASPQIEPDFKAWVESMGGPGSDKDRVVQATREAKRQLAEASGEAERPDFAALDWRGRMALQRERYARILVPEGFRLVAPSRGFTHFQRRTTDDKYVFSLLDDSATNLAFGSLQCQFAITWPGTQISSARLYAMRLAAFRPEQLVPEFRWSSHFESGSWPQFCVAADTVACLTAILFRRLDAALQNRSM